jgi:Raf kinase inhibitor-like YbhB/YbcL family protein
MKSASSPAHSLSFSVSLARSLRRAAALVLLGAVVACGAARTAPRTPPGRELSSITVTSPAFGQGSRIPVDHTCDGDDAMPELVLSSPPDGTKSLVIIVDDPDAPSGTFTHLVAFNLSPDVSRLRGGELAGAGPEARFGSNDFGAAHYSGPCPPRYEAHRYFFRVYALDTMLTLPEGSPRERVDAAMDGHVLGEGVLMGHFAH